MTLAPADEAARRCPFCLRVLSKTELPQARRCVEHQAIRRLSAQRAYYRRALDQYFTRRAIA